MRAYSSDMGEAMNIRYGAVRQLVGTQNAAVAASIMVVFALCLGSGTAAAVTFPSPVTQDGESIAASPEALLPSSGLADAPSLEIALLGGERSDEDAMFEAAQAADDEGVAALASADPRADFAAEGDAYSETASASGFESSGHGRAWRGSLLAAGVTAAIVAGASSRHASHGFNFGALASHGPSGPSSSPSIGSGETPGNDPPADVPEPGTCALLAAGMMISAAFRRRLNRA
jgi:hypothetical protein